MRRYKADQARAPKRSTVTMRALRNRVILISPPEVPPQAIPARENAVPEDPFEILPRYEPVKSVSLKTRAYQKSRKEPKTHERSELVSIENQPGKTGKYKTGDLVMAKCYRWPFHPGMVVLDPVIRGQVIGEDGQKANKKPNYVHLNSRKQVVEYHIQFFGNALYHAWIPVDQLEPFIGWNAWQADFITKLEEFENVSEQMAYIRKVGVCENANPTRKANWKLAIGEAEEALKLGRYRRIRLLTYQYVDVIEDGEDGEIEESEIEESEIEESEMEEVNP